MRWFSKKNLICIANAWKCIEKSVFPRTFVLILKNSKSAKMGEMELWMGEELHSDLSKLTMLIVYMIYIDNYYRAKPSRPMCHRRLF